MTSLQLGLIVAGVALVIGVLIYNWWQERRVRSRIDAAFRAGTGGEGVAAPSGTQSGGEVDRVEPRLGGDAGDDQPMLTRASTAQPKTRGRVSAEDDSAAGFELPIAVQARLGNDAPSAQAAVDLPTEAEVAWAGTGDDADAFQRIVHADSYGPQPDPDIECIVPLQPEKPVRAGALAPALNARLGKRLRWFGRRGISMPWQLLKAETAGEFSEVIACLLLADRTGAASAPMLQSFVALATDLARSLPATLVAPDVPAEAGRAETLDRICADLDVQIGLTILKGAPNAIQGTRLRGVAEAAGFRLGAGRFEWVQEETGAVLYALQNFRSEPFTADNLRNSSTPGAVLLLDVPRVADPGRVFDQMKLAAKRMAQTLDAALVDDNRRPLDDAALAMIRQQIQKTVAGLEAVHIVPGSPRALALFGG